MSNDQPKWGEPGNAASSKLYEAGALAAAYDISPDRAQMLIDRHGRDPAALQGSGRETAGPRRSRKAEH